VGRQQVAAARWKNYAVSSLCVMFGGESGDEEPVAHVDISVFQHTV
jgi:hypothetical protein